MKNKNFTIGLTLLLASAFFLTDCTKGKKNEPPSPDYEFESTIEMNRMQIILSDIHEICAVTSAGSYSSLLPWMSHTPMTTLQGTNTINSVAATVGATVLPSPLNFEATFNNTIGKDGHVRNGKLIFYAGATTTVPACEYYDQPGWTAVVSAVNYSIDDYTVAINSMTITNTTIVGFPASPNTPSNTALTWRQDADVTITRAVGSSTQTNSFKGTIYKTLLNTNTGVFLTVPTATNSIGYAQATFTAYKPSPRQIFCEKQWASYSGQGNGSLQDAGPYGVTFSGLTRNFNASPEKFLSITTSPTITPGFVTPERHPFLSGTMSFKPGAKPTRDVDFGSNDHFDYNAKVTISGITYDVDCKD